MDSKINEQGAYEFNHSVNTINAYTEFNALSFKKNDYSLMILNVFK